MKFSSLVTYGPYTYSVTGSCVFLALMLVDALRASWVGAKMSFCDVGLKPLRIFCRLKFTQFIIICILRSFTQNLSKSNAIVSDFLRDAY